MEGNWVLAWLRLPYRQFEIVSTLPREAAMARINGIVEAHSPLIATFVRTNKLFAGDVSSDRFKIKRIVNYRSGMVPVIEGVFEPAPSGSRIRVTMRLAYWIAGFYGLWFGATMILLLLSALGLLPSSHATSGLSGLFPLTFVYVVGAIGFNFETNKARRLLEAALKTAPSGQVEQVLNNAVKPRLSRFLKVRLIGGAVGAGMIAIAMLVAPFLPQSELRVAENFIKQNPTIRAELGSISSVERASSDGFHKSEPGGQDEGIFEVNVTGAQKSGVVLLSMVRENHGWSIKSAQLEADGRTMLLAAPASD
jgi:hypothetical protein